MTSEHDDDQTEPPEGASQSGSASEPGRLAATPRPRVALPPAGSVGMVGIGGAAGALARSGQSAPFPVQAGAFPWITLAENLVGAFLLGVLLTVLVERVPTVWWLRPLLGTGLLGAYTTYATVGLELHQLVAQGSAGLAALYLWATAVAGLLAGGAGIAAARRRFTGSR